MAAIKLRYSPEEYIDSFGSFQPHAFHKKYANFLVEKGKHWLYKPCGFQVRLDREGKWKSQTYTPTFYVAEDKKFVHVVATYSAFYDYQIIFEAFRAQYPQHQLAVMNYTGMRVGTNEKNLNKKCSVAGCDKEALVKGMCRAHYYKVKRKMIDPSGAIIGVDHRFKNTGKKEEVTSPSKTPKKKRRRKAAYRPAL